MIKNLDYQTFYCIILRGTSPTFYKFKITSELARLVKEGIRLEYGSMPFTALKFQTVPSEIDLLNQNHLTSIFKCYYNMRKMLEAEIKRINKLKNE